MEEVSLLIDGQVFKVRKETLCEHSDYFRAMFSGSYVENDQNEIKLDVLDAGSMSIITRYMEIGLIDLTDLSLSSMNDLSIAVNFLQMTELMKQIEYTLDMKLSLTNWMEILDIAENACYSKLEQSCAAFGLFSFKYMDPEHIPSIHRLFWYLSHPYLDARSELDVFKFGRNWILHSETGADAFMILLGCLDVYKLRYDDLNEINKLMTDYDISLAAKVVDCLVELSSVNNRLTVEALVDHKDSLYEKFSERVYKETLSLVKESKRRLLSLIPVVPVWSIKDSKPEFVPHDMYTFCEEKGLEKWVEVAERNLWGWSVVSWGLWRLVVICGEHGRGTGSFMRDVKVYDALRKEWIHHGVELPPRRHGGVAVIKDSLYIIGGVGGFRVVLDTAVVYNLNERTFRQMARLPDAIQSPAVCAHEGQIYAAGHNNIYRYEDLGETDHWVRVIGTEVRMSSMVSFKGSIYCTQNYFSYLHVFKPGVDTRLALITGFTNPPAAVCNLGNKLLFFTRNLCGQSEILNSAEEYYGRSRDEAPRVVWSRCGTGVKVNDVAGACSLVLAAPPLHRQLSPYHKSYLDRYFE